MFCKIVQLCKESPLDFTIKDALRALVSQVALSTSGSPVPPLPPEWVFYWPAVSSCATSAYRLIFFALIVNVDGISKW